MSSSSSVAFFNGAAAPTSSPTTPSTPSPLCTAPPSFVRPSLWNLSFLMESGGRDDATTTTTTAGASSRSSPVEEEEETAGKVVLKEKDGVAKIRRDHWTVMERILGSVVAHNDSATEYRVHPLKNGNCNAVYGITPSSDATVAPTMVVKVFSPLAQIRLEGCRHAFGAVDAIASGLGVGPRLLSIDPEGICSSFVHDAIDLTEAQLHSDARLCRQIGQLLARLHAGVDQLEVTDGEAQQNLMLWFTLDRMVAYIAARRGDGMPHGFCVEDLQREVQQMKAALRSFALPIVLSHGDCKAANVLSTAGQVYLIDFELAGRSYRGYDVCKLFRSATEESVSHQRAFAHAYLAQQGQSLTKVTEKEVDLFLAEAALFEPLTWLEAAIFFVFSAVGTQEDSDNGTEKKWQMKARDRWNHYLESKKLLPQRIQHYQEVLESDR